MQATSLGNQIHKLLLKNGLENPFFTRQVKLWHDKEYILGLELMFAKFLQNLGLNLHDESLADTPKRVVDNFINELCYGLDYKNFPEIVLQENHCEYTSPIMIKNIRVNSLCEHHLVSIDGMAYISYIPDKKIIGFGTLVKIVDFFSRRPQLQERLTRQVYFTLKEILITANIAVGINAKHDCINNRGLRGINNEVFTVELGGKFLTDESLKNNFCQTYSK